MGSGKKRAYLGLVAFCLLALFVDRVVLSKGAAGPSRAEASLSVGLAGDNLSDLEENRPIPTVAFPAVARDPEEHPPRDFFARPDKRTLAELSGAAPGMRGKEGLLHSAFERNAKLAGVILTADGGIAVVNGTRMVRGDSLLGCTLEKVFGRSAHFRCPDGEAVLLIAPRSPKTAN